MSPAPLTCTLPLQRVRKDGATQHNSATQRDGIAALHSAVCTKLLESCGMRRAQEELLWEKPSLLTLQTHHTKWPRTTRRALLPRRARGIGHPPQNGLRSQKARLCLGPLLSHRPGWDGDTSRASPATMSGLALPAAPGHSQPQLRHRFHVSPRASPWPTLQYCTAGRKRCPDTVNLFLGGMEGYAFNFFPLKLCFFKHQGMGKESFGSWTPSRLEQHLWLVVSHPRGPGAPALRLCKCSLSTFFFQWNVLSKRKILKGCNSNFGGECSVTTLPVCKGQNSEGPTNLF